MKKEGVPIFQLSLICTLKAIDVIEKGEKKEKRFVDWAKGFKHTVLDRDVTLTEESDSTTIENFWSVYCTSQSEK